jgi:hypothetical protein
MSEPNSSLLLYQTEDGRTRIECRFENESVWLTQKLMAELFHKDVRTINEHIQNIFAEAELAPESVIRKFRITAADGKTYETQHYNLDAIISVGYRVKSLRGTQFRQWATARLREYIVKGFTMDDERLKNPPGPGQKDYFDEQLERIRDIRSSERRFYQKVLDIYATSVDYDPSTEASQLFFATVQNKMHWAAHGQTAAEVIHARADAKQPLTESHRQCLHRVRRIAGAATAGHDHAGLDRQARRLFADLRPQVAQPCRPDQRGGSEVEGRVGIREIPCAVRLSTPPGGS